jgi:hypothetical protein
MQQLTEETTERLEAAAMKILRRRYGHVRPVLEERGALGDVAASASDFDHPEGSLQQLA